MKDVSKMRALSRYIYNLFMKGNAQVPLLSYRSNGPTKQDAVHRTPVEHVLRIPGTFYRKIKTQLRCRSAFLSNSQEDPNWFETLGS